MSTGRFVFPVSRIQARFYQGPWNGQVREVSRSACRWRHGRRCLKVPDPKDPSGFVWYAQAKRLPRGYGVPERWMTVDEDGNWVHDQARYHPGEYDPKEQELPWEEHGAEGPPGGDVE